MSIIDVEFLERILYELICNRGYIIAFIGSPLRGDDRIGLTIYDELDVEDDKTTIRCEYGLETCLAEISEAKPTGLIIVDAVKVSGKKPGEIVFASIDNVVDNIVSVSTHNIPLKLSLRILRENTGLEDVVILGVVVDRTDISLEITPAVLKAGRKIADVLNRVLRRCYKN